MCFSPMPNNVQRFSGACLSSAYSFQCDSFSCVLPESTAWIVELRSSFVSKVTELEDLASTGTFPFSEGSERPRSTGLKAAGLVASRILRRALQSLRETGWGSVCHEHPPAIPPWLSGQISCSCKAPGPGEATSADASSKRGRWLSDVRNSRGPGRCLIGVTYAIGTQRDMLLLLGRHLHFCFILRTLKKYYNIFFPVLPPRCLCRGPRISLLSNTSIHSLPGLLPSPHTQAHLPLTSLSWQPPLQMHLLFLKLCLLYFVCIYLSDHTPSFLSLL